MKKIIALSTVAFLSTALYADAAMQKQIDELTKKIDKLEKKQGRNTKNIGKVNALANKDNIKFDIDFRTSYDNLEYETVGGTKHQNNALYSNRLWLGMGYAPTDTMIFKGQLAYNKAFGASYNQRGMGFDTFDWISNETLADDKLRVREAYWLWTPTVGDFPLTVSVGRRPSTNGYLINLRDDDAAKSPNGHVINMEFDGASAGISLDKYVPGMLFKLCLGRGLTNAAAWASEASMMTSPTGSGSNVPNFAKDESAGKLDNTDMAGFIFKAYNDGQYAVEGTWYRGFSVPGIIMNAPGGGGAMGDMKTLGDMDGAAISLKIDGIGNEISDFLDETVFFASYAMSTSRPNYKGDMLGSDSDETGNSFWVGTQMPNFTGGKFGLEYNKGSEYWRPFTYGEDTVIGSKLAARGDAYEAYWTQPLIDDVFSMQVRYTYIKYEYTGSNGFFGDGGAPIKMSDTAALAAKGMDPVETAQDLRVYFRYRY